MDRIRFEVHRAVFSDVVVPVINDRSLISILRRVELPLAEREGSPSIAGGYKGLPAKIVLPPSKHLLGEPNEAYSYRGKTTVLDCECECEGCWSFIVKIEVDEGKVRWSGFEQIHRPEWKYDSLREFVFDKNEYEAALREQRPESE